MAMRSGRGANRYYLILNSIFLRLSLAARGPSLSHDESQHAALGFLWCLVVVDFARKGTLPGLVGRRPCDCDGASQGWWSVDSYRASHTYPRQRG